MKVAMVSSACCVRVVKEGTALDAAGVDVTYLHTTVSNACFVPALRSESRWHEGLGLVDKLRALRPDVVHVHAEPAELVTWAWLACPDAALVFDVHDSELMRSGADLDAEREAFRLADAFVWPSRAYARDIPALRPDECGGKPGAVIYSWPAGWMLPKLSDPLPRLPALVYEGGAFSAEQTRGQRLYRDYRDLVVRCNREGIPLVLHCTNQAGADSLTEAGGLALGPLPYPQLMRSLSRYSWGLCAPAVFPSQHWASTNPNKLYEYGMAGLPVLTWGSPEVSEHVRERGTGVALESPDELTAKLWRSLQRRRGRFLAAVERERQACVMETQLPALVALYSRAAHAHKEKRP